MGEDHQTTDSVIHEFLCFALYSASRAMTQLYGKHLANVGLTYPQLLVMILLWEKNDRPVGSFAENLFLDTGTLTPLLKRLEAKELITRVRGKEDERTVLIRLTPKGKKLQLSLGTLGADMLCDLEMQPEQVKKMAASIHEIRNTIATKIKKAN